MPPLFYIRFPFTFSFFSFLRGKKMEGGSVSLVIGMALASFLVIQVSGHDSSSGRLSGGHYDHQMRKMQALKASLLRRDSVSSPPSSAPAAPLTPVESAARVFRVTSYGADPTGKADSTDAILRAFSDVFNEESDNRVLMEGIKNLGGPRIDLEGGTYLISRPLRFPGGASGNVVIHGGTLKASDDFPADDYLINLSSSSSSAYNYEYITLRDLMLDSNYRGGGIADINNLRITIDNCYIAHFNTTGILIKGGHETLVHSSFLGQHITAGSDRGERDFSGTAIDIQGNDHIITDVVIFSAAVGIMVSGQANMLTGVHCYNKATGFGGTGIYLKLPERTQTRIVNCYMDYTRIVVEDPVQLLISNSFFLGDAFVLFKSINGVAKGINVVDNMFSGQGKGVEIVQLEGPFKDIDQVVVDRNMVEGMKAKATVGRQSTNRTGTSWDIDFNPILLFPDHITHVQYSFQTAGFPVHALRNVSDNRVVIESNVPVTATVYVTVEQ